MSRASSFGFFTGRVVGVVGVTTVAGVTAPTFRAAFASAFTARVSAFAAVLAARVSTFTTRLSAFAAVFADCAAGFVLAPVGLGVALAAVAVGFFTWPLPRPWPYTDELANTMATSMAKSLIFPPGWRGDLGTYLSILVPDCGSRVFSKLHSIATA